MSRATSWFCRAFAPRSREQHNIRRHPEQPLTRPRLHPGSFRYVRSHAPPARPAPQREHAFRSSSTSAALQRATSHGASQLLSSARLMFFVRRRRPRHQLRRLGHSIDPRCLPPTTPDRQQASASTLAASAFPRAAAPPSVPSQPSLSASGPSSASATIILVVSTGFVCCGIAPHHRHHRAQPQSPSPAQHRSTASVSEAASESPRRPPAASHRQQSAHRQRR